LRYAKCCLETAQKRQKCQVDRHRRPAPEFAPGGEVFVQTRFFKLYEGIQPKLAPRSLGPFKVLANIGPANLAYRFELPRGMQRVHPVFPVSAIKRYHRSGNYQPPPPREIINDELEFEVDGIADTCGTGCRRRYQVCWGGYPDQFHWKPVRNLTNCVYMATPHVHCERLQQRTHILFHGLLDDKVLPQQLSGRLLVTGDFEIPR
jgi:hypothetical protein